MNFHQAQNLISKVLIIRINLRLSEETSFECSNSKAQVGKHKAISHGDIGLLQRDEKRIYDAPVALMIDKGGQDRIK